MIVLEGPDTVWMDYYNNSTTAFYHYVDSTFRAFDRDSQDITTSVIVAEVNLYYTLGLHYLNYNVRDKYGISAFTRRRFFRYKRLLTHHFDTPQ